MSQRSSATFLVHGSRKLDALSAAMGFSPQRMAEARGLLQRMLAPWGELPIGTEPRWPSNIGDDHSPYEFSLALGGAPELRILVEPLGTLPSLISNRDRALEVLAELGRDYEVDMRRLDIVADLFLPAQPQGDFSLWIAASLWPEKKPAFKVYLNPQAQGPALAPALVEEAMVRLGFPDAYAAIGNRLARRGPELDELKYFSLDMRDNARVKVYARHHQPTHADLEKAAQAAGSYVAGDVSRFVDAMCGVPFLAGRALATCLAFHGSTTTATFHLPIKGYAPNDQVAAERISAFLQAEELSAEPYLLPLQRFAERPLSDGIGLQSYSSFRRQGGQPRLTVYLATELYRPGLELTPPMRAAPRSAVEIVERFGNEPLTDHPLFRRLRREPVSLQRLYLLLANAQIGIVNGFARRLATVTSDDERLRTLLAKQLHDELGAGDPERAHTRLFASMLAGLERWRPSIEDGAMLPGIILDKTLDRAYADPQEGLGATMVAEIFGKQVDRFTGDEFRRQSLVDPASLAWLHLHETLEIDHANEAREMADLVAAFDPAWRGAKAMWLAAHAFFDGVYEVLYARAT